LKNIAGLIGDLSNVFNKHIGPILKQKMNFVENLIQRLKSSDDPEIMEISTYATNHISNAIN